MKRTLFQASLTSLFTIILLVSSGYSSIHDPAYHHLDEIYEEIFALQEEFPQWVRVDSIGCSQQEKLPIYAVRITEDVYQPMGRKPAVIFNGQVHAEEVLGIELCIWLMNKMVRSNSGFPIEWRSNVDVYFIPTANPEGLNVVYELDESYRKNKRDNIGDGIFRYFPGWGSDSSGVDINRNFPFFWSHGEEKLFEKGANELYDYYRGPAPASETETQCLIDFYEKIRPMYSVTLHSSRTGNVAEQVIYPWGWGQDSSYIKMCPDIAVFDELAYQVANRCKKYGQDKPYKTVRIVAPRGDSESYYYWEYGTFGMRIEIGAKGESMQPDAVGIKTVINDTRLGMEYLLNSAAQIQSQDEKGPFNRSRIEFWVRDAVTDQPLSARIKMNSLSKPVLPYKYTSPHTGRYFLPSYNGFFDDITVSKFGYETYVKTNASVGQESYLVGGRQGVKLEPLDWYSVRLKLVDPNGMDISDQVKLFVDHPDTSWTDEITGGSTSLLLPVGTYTFTFYSDLKYVPRRISAEVQSDTTWQIGLSWAVTLLNQNFDNTDIAFISDNKGDIPYQASPTDSIPVHWETTNDLYHSAPRCLTDSRNGGVQILEDTWCVPYNGYDLHFDLSNSQTAALSYWLNQALEPGHDSVTVEFWTPDSGWVQVAPAHDELQYFEQAPILNWQTPDMNLQRYNPWKHFIIPLDNWCGPEFSEVHFRFRLKSDKYVQTDGIYIDDVQLLAGTSQPPAVTSSGIIPLQFELGTPYPNPFNSQVNVMVSLPQAGPITMVLYDLQGRTIRRELVGDFIAGAHRLAFNAGSLPTGLYLIQISTAEHSAIRKIMLVK